MVAALPSPLFLWRRHPFPVVWHEAFGLPPTCPLHLEVGFGDGRYTVYRAAETPNEGFVALEISGASVVRAMRRVREAELHNVRLLKVEAAFALRHLFAPHTLSSITVNFPDPWPKARHAEHRLLRAPFFTLAASRLAVGGEVRLATDHLVYLESARAEADTTGLYRLIVADPPAAVFETKYALKWKAQGKRLYYQRFCYLGGPTPDAPGLEKPFIMPHAILTGVLEDAPPFRKQVTPYADGHVILQELARSLTPPDTLLVRATVEEPELHQQVLVAVRAKPNGEVVVGLEAFGDPVITKTTRGAVHAVTEWLLTSTPLTLKQRSY